MMKTWNSSQHQWKSNMVAQHKPKIHWFHISVLKNDGRKELSLCFPLHWTCICGCGLSRCLVRKGVGSAELCDHVHALSGTPQIHLVWFWIHFFCCAFRNLLLLPSTSWEPHFNYQPLQDAVHFPGWALVCTSECPGRSGLLVCWDTNRACGFLVRAALKMCWNVLSARARGRQNNSSTPWLSK